MSSESSDPSSDSSSAARETLSDRILGMLVKSVFDLPHRDFLPEGCARTLITKPAVITEFKFTTKDMDSKSNLKLLDFILNGGARKIFAITLCAGFRGKELRKAMTLFRRKQFVDANLPVTAENFPFSEKPWDSLHIRAFCSQQWEFLAPVFSNEGLKLELQANHILPFIFKHDDVKSGAFGEVHQVRIHPSHHINPVLTYDHRPANVAVKEIKQGYTTDETKLRDLEREWEREVKTHIDIKNLNHKHIIEFIAAITREKRYLMFRWADGGNLREFWQNNKRPKMNACLVRDVIVQLRGLVDALNELHNYEGGSYRHGDIKPENILRVRTRSPDDPQLDVGVLKIADMGLAKHHTVATEFRPPTSMRYTTYRYEPPEVLTDSSLDRGRSRRYDIWSIGCVMLELIIWLLYGTDVLDDVSNKYIVGELGEPSPYFEIEKDKDGNKKIGKVHPAVHATMNAIERDQECLPKENTAMRGLLRIVKTKLLVVSLNEAGSTSTQSKTEVQVGFRVSAKILRDALDDIICKGKENERYWYTGKNRDHIKRLQIARPQGSNLLLSPDYKPSGRLGIPTRQRESVPFSSETITFSVPMMPKAPKDVCVLFVPIRMRVWYCY